MKHRQISSVFRCVPTFYVPDHRPDIQTSDRFIAPNTACFSVSLVKLLIQLISLLAETSGPEK